MNSMMRLTHVILLLLIVNSLSATVITRDLGNGKTETCTLDNSEEYGQTGDTQGKRVYTKIKYSWDCVISEQKQGACQEYELDTKSFRLAHEEEPPAYSDTVFNSGLEEVASTLNAFDKINGVWSGWKGICFKGIPDGAFDWMTDPLTLAGYALTAYTANGGDFGLAQTAEVAPVNNSTSSLGALKQSEATIQGAKVATQKLVTMTTCAIRAGIDLGKIYEEYTSSDEACDPVDEFCGEEDGNTGSQEMSIPKSSYEDIIANNPDAIDYIEILEDDGSGVIIIRIVSPPTQDDIAAAEAKRLAEEAKEMKMKVSVLVTTLSTAGCLATGDTASGSSDSESITSVKNLSTMAVGMMCPTCGMALDIAMNLAASYTPIDTCNDEGEAEEEGERHLSTLKSKRIGLCHPISVDVKSGSFGKADSRTYNYCCYDDKMSRIIVEQGKAQFGKDWQHCTDISINELKNISFNECTEEDKTKGVDGVALAWDATNTERFGAYQYKQKCMDLGEFKAHVVERVSDTNAIFNVDDFTNTIINEFR